MLTAHLVSPSRSHSYPTPAPVWRKPLHCHHVQPGIWIESVKDGENNTTVSKQASSYLLPTILLSGSNSHSGMGLRIWFRGGAGWAQDSWWGYYCCLSMPSCSLEAGVVVAELQPIFSLQLSTAKPGRTGNTREEMRNCTSYMGILFRHTKIGWLHAGL